MFEKEFSDVEAVIIGRQAAKYHKISHNVPSVDRNVNRNLVNLCNQTLCDIHISYQHHLRKWHKISQRFLDGEMSLAVAV